MSLNHVILGLLKKEPLTGYELKKIIQGTPFMYWSGNNNQIYKAFVELLEEGYVSKEVAHQDGAPSKNIYTLTKDGDEAFKEWMLSVTDTPSFRKQFLMKLSLSETFSRDELETMVNQYMDTVRMQKIFSDRELDKSYFRESASIQSGKIMDLIKENILSFYEQELSWAETVREHLKTLPGKESTKEEIYPEKGSEHMEDSMKLIVFEKNNLRYLHLSTNGQVLGKKEDGLDLISLCGEHDTHGVLLEAEKLSEDFTQLRTGVAGEILQKLSNYRVRLAVVVSENQDYPSRFKEMIKELHKGDTFRLFTALEDAKNWI